MDIAGKIEGARRIVERLVMQYREHHVLGSDLKSLETEKLKRLAKASAKAGIALSEAKRRENEFADVVECDRRIALLKRDQDQLSDEMTFADPLIWMMYKHEAYRGAAQEIRDWAAFKAHCAPEDSICGKRYRGLVAYLGARHHIDLDAMFPDDADLPRVYGHESIAGLLDDLDFMEFWKTQEYSRTGSINKWGSLSAIL
jgi:hypothetical protein